ncbi:MAG TPA: carbohydrate ABC transporter permease [Candidatus Limnocylindrales bacterium]|jgi:multiple sugar transport system permease protein|nr:carbohydrate ABC transporter permease [Candidatus Limnocylindrales bacterium]
MTVIPARAPAPTISASAGGARARGTWWIYLLLILGILLMVGPFLWMLLGSLKTQAEFLASPPTFLPNAASTDNYERLFTQLDFPRFFFNSSLVAVIVTVGNVLFCPMLGFALAKLQWRGKRLIMGLVLATLMVPAGITLIPNFVLMANLGLVNTFPGLILPFLVLPFGVFLTRQFMYGIPDELLEAARIDGANEWRIFWQVVIPLSVPVLATLGILTFLGSWNSFIYPLVMAQEPEMYTLPVALATFATGDHQSDHGMLMAGSVVLVVPVLIVFILFQRWITEGIATTGLKG